MPVPASTVAFQGPDVAVPTNPLVQPSLRWLVEMHLEGSFPLHLTNDQLTTARMGAGPELVSTLDIAPPIIGGIGWSLAVAGLFPAIWIPCDENANAPSFANKGTWSGAAIRVPSTQELDVQSPIAESSTYAKQFLVPGGVRHRALSPLLLNLAGPHAFVFWLKTGLPTGTVIPLEYVSTGGTSVEVALQANGVLRVTYGGTTAGRLFGPNVADNNWHMIVIDCEAEDTSGGRLGAGEGGAGEDIWGTPPTTPTMTLYVDNRATGSLRLATPIDGTDGVMRFGVCAVSMDEIIWFGTVG